MFVEVAGKFRMLEVAAGMVMIVCKYGGWPWFNVGKFCLLEVAKLLKPWFWLRRYEGRRLGFF